MPFSTEIVIASLIFAPLVLWLWRDAVWTARMVRRVDRELQELDEQWMRDHEEPVERERPAYPELTEEIKGMVRIKRPPEMTSTKVYK